MISGFVEWYLSGLAEFWANALTIRVPHVLIMVLLLWWFCGKGKGRRMDWGCCGSSRACGCGCSCGGCCCGTTDDGGEAAEE